MREYKFCLNVRTPFKENLQVLIANLDEKSFIYDLLLAYGLSKSAILTLNRFLCRGQWPRGDTLEEGFL